MILVLSFLLLIAESVFPLHLNSNKVDTIQNGWIELMQLDPIIVYNITASLQSNTEFRDSIRFVAKCNENYQLNSNSSEVMPVKLKTKNSWIPINDYLVQGLPLCSRDCAFQSSLANGFIQIEANPKAILKDNSLIKAYENSQVKFHCFDGYKLRSITYKQVQESENNKEASFKITSIVYKGKALIEKCGPNGTESAFINEFDDQTNFVGQTSPEGEKIFHQCVKECSLFQTDFAEMNGFLVPARHQYAPGDQLQFLCKEGYVAEMPVIVSGTFKEYKLSNKHTMECSLNGTWHFVPETPSKSSDSNPMSKYFKTGLTNSALKTLAKCSTMESFMHKQRAAAFDNNNDNGPTDPAWSLSSNSAHDLNLNTFAMMFGIGGCIMLLLLTSLITMRLVQRKRYNFRDLFNLAPTDPLLIPTETTGSELRTAPAPHRSHTQAQTQLSGPMDTIERSVTSTNLIRHLSNAYLPTYEEAISQQPPTVTIQQQPEQAPPNPFSSQPTTSRAVACNSKTEHIIDETTSIIEIAPTTLQSLGLYNTQSGRSGRNNGGRSNLSIRSGGGSLRTSSSTGSANFNLLPPSSSRHKNNIRARRLHNYKNLSNHNRNRASSTQTATLSQSETRANVNGMATGSAESETAEERGEASSADEVVTERSARTEVVAGVAPNTNSI